VNTSRDQIISKTCELLELQGYHATGLNQIIKESGSPKGSLYYYFPGGKEELASEAVQYVGQIVLARIQENLASADSPSTAIADFIRNVAYNVELSGFRAGGPITTIAMETASTNPTLREVCQHIYTGWQNAVADKLMAGGFSSERAQSLSCLVISAIEGGIILARTRQSRQALEQVADELERLIGT